MKILVVAPDVPFPANHGARSDMLSRLACFKELNFDVDLLICGSHQLDDDVQKELLKFVGRVDFFSRSAHLRYLLKFKPYQVESRIALAKFSSTTCYDLVFLESEAVGYVLESPGLLYKYSALRVHNDESRYFLALVKSVRNPILKLYYLLESFLYARYSERIKAIVNFELHISREEFEISNKRSAAKESREIMLLPSHIDSQSMVAPVEKGGKKALFVGNLFTPNNLNGLFWYLDNVHGILIDKVPNYRLVVAGNTRKNNIGDKISRYESVEFHDTPASLECLYDDSSVFVNPMLEGAGVKIRSLNAICQGLPLVSTPVGVEGIGLTNEVHFYEAATPEDFANSVIKCLGNSSQSKDMAVRAQKFISAEFDARKVILNVKSKIDGERVEGSKCC